MAVKKILLFPDPALSTPSQPISSSEPTLTSLIADLTDTLYKSPGVGLAAPQIGVLKQVSVIDVRHRKKPGQDAAPENHGLIVLINPVLLKGTGEQIPREGCLSVPDLLANVRRYQTVTVRTERVDGGETVITASGFEALALQHEIDHLNGMLFLDRVLNIKTDIFRRKTRG
jgi:peptide deformylase